MEQPHRPRLARSCYVIILFNSTAGKRAEVDKVCVEIVGALQKHGIVPTIWRADSGAEVPILARRAAEGGDETIVAAGGDGTVHSVGSALVGSSKRMGVLPLGTLNHFAKDLGLPLNVAAATEILATGHERSVDVGEVNGQIFLNNSSLGLYPRIVRRRDEQRQKLRRGKWPAFAWAVLSALHVCPALRMRLRADDQETVVRTPFLFIGNNAYRTDFLRIGSRERLDAGRLSVYFARGSNRRDVLRLAFRSLIGRLEQAANFERFTTEKLLVEMNARRLDVSLDGELFRMELPLSFQTRPRALRVMAPTPTVTP